MLLVSIKVFDLLGKRLRWRQCMAFILAAVTLVLLFLVLQLSVALRAQTDDKVLIREVSVVAIIPPPPLPKTAKSLPQAVSHIPQINLNTSGQGAALKFSKKPVIEAIQLHDLQSPEFANFSPDWSESLAIEWTEFDMDDVDEIPQILRRSSPKIPLAIRSKGVRKVTILLNIMIDETGKVYLREVLENQYPEMLPIIKSFVRSAKFTKPKMNGIPVSAMYKWRVEFRY